MFDDENQKAGKKQFKKEMRGGGYSEGLARRPGQDPSKDGPQKGERGTRTTLAEAISVFPCVGA